MIGLFDSGFGGLHVLRSITKRLPEYDYIYLGDSARIPYGPRSSEEVYEFTKQGVEFLFERGATLVVLACNTASSEALRKIQQGYQKDSSDRKVLGVLIPFAESAAMQTKTKRVGVMATEGTVRSLSFPREIMKINNTIKVFQQSCPLLVPLIEAGEQDSDAAEELIHTYLMPLLKENIDTLVLGCTHYGIVEGKIRACVGPGIYTISEENVMPASVAMYLKRHPDLETRIGKSGRVNFCCTGDNKRFENLGSMFFKERIQAERVEI